MARLRPGARLPPCVRRCTLTEKELRSLEFAQTFGRLAHSRNHEHQAHLSERARTVAPNRQAGGHWFEPSTAHRKALHKGFFVAQSGDVGVVVARIRVGCAAIPLWRRPPIGSRTVARSLQPGRRRTTLSWT